MQVADLELKGHTLVKGRGEGGGGRGGGEGKTLSNKFLGTSALGS